MPRKKGSSRKTKSSRGITGRRGAIKGGKKKGGKGKKLKGGAWRQKAYK